jgi:pimeloyl-ACP methyl ester carboxylesterase
LVGELNELLDSGGVPAPYILVGHSLGGLVVQLYARIYPDQVQGLVFVDAFSATLRSTLRPLLPLYRDRVLNPPPRDEPIPSLALADSERVDLDASIDQVERAPPLRPMPLIVLTKTEPFRIAPGWLPAGMTLDQIDDAYTRAQTDLVALAPTTPQIFATGSEHYIQLSQPDLVINAVRLVVTRATSRDK